MVTSISFVTTVYNRERYLSAAIESILTQTYQEFELLIWDDGSSDDSVEIAQHYAAQDERIRVIAAPHQGRSPALKAAVAATTGTYVGVVDSDDLLARTALEETVDVLDAHPEIGLVYTDYLVIDEDNSVKGYGQRCRVPYSKDRLLIDFIVFHFRLIRRSIYDQVGGIDESFVCCQDYDLCLRVSEVTEIVQLKKPLYYYRHHKQSISGEQRVEQIFWGKEAIERALQRRGLADEYELEVQILARCSLLRKNTRQSVNSYSLPSASSSSSLSALSLPLSTALTAQYRQFDDFLTQPERTQQSDSVSLPESAIVPSFFNTNLPFAPDCGAEKFTPWALTSEALEWIAQFVEAQGIRTIVECGSGQSTIRFSSLKLERVLSLEHDSNWYADTHRQLEEKGGLKYVDLQLCQLRQLALNGKLVKWYDINTLLPFPTDLILVDGPPGNSSIWARYPAPHLLKAFIHPGTWILLDDYYRQQETEMVNLWLKEIPELELIKVVPFKDGLAVLRCSGG